MMFVLGKESGLKDKIDVKLETDRAVMFELEELGLVGYILMHKGRKSR